MPIIAPSSRRRALLLISVVAWFAVVLQFILMLRRNNTANIPVLWTIINFFSYFTILSNILVAKSSAITLIAPDSFWGRFFSRPSVVSAIALYIFIVGLVYNIALRGLVVLTGWDIVANELLHVVVPLGYILYWFFFTPRKTLEWHWLGPWLVFPGCFLLYSLIRGAIVHWYPYPFLDAGKLRYAKVIANSGGVLIAFVVTGSLLISINRRGMKNAG